MIELRTLTDADLPAVRQLDGWAFGYAASDARWDVASSVLERQRQTGAFDSGQLVGHTAAFTHRLTVPGGVIPAAGVTWVGVTPAHRRQGVVSRLLTHQLHHLSTNGEAVATLWASEPGIYARFGYGVASRRVSLTVPRPAQLDGSKPQGWTLRLGDATELLDECMPVFNEAHAQVPGMVTRSPQAWREGSFDERGSSSTSSPLRCALALDGDGCARGYVWFRTTPHWDAGDPDGTVEVSEIVATEAGASRALLDLVLDIDLMSRTTFWNLPLDHPLLTWAQHHQRLHPRIDDQLWVRLVRLDEALAARGYGAPIDVVLQVDDDICPWNQRRWRLSADTSGAAVSPTRAAPDVRIDAGDLAAAYLGDDVLHRALVADALAELTPGAGLALARALRGDRAPWCAYMF